MFKKTRNRIMLLNMVMVSAVVVIAFAVIFAIIYSQEKASNREKLMNNTIPQVSFVGRPFRVDTAHAEPFPEGFTGFAITSGTTMSGFTQLIIPGSGLSFSLLVDTEGNLIDVNSVLNLPDAIYQQAAFEATKNSRRDATVTLGGRTWQYEVSAVTVEFVESSNIAFVVSGAYSDIRFLDVTDSYRMLWSLGLTLGGLTVVILAAFFFISRFFAKRAIRPMEEAFEKQSRFVADASHELKTPLSVINANCGVLYSNKEETMESQIKWVDSITRATDRMTGLVGDLLSLARLEDKEHEIRIASFDMGAALGEAVAEMEQAAFDKGLSIDTHIEPDAVVFSDREQVSKILVILLDNAIKYTDSGGELSVSLKREKRHVICAIRNSGDGIPQEELPRLFDRFYRGDPSRTSENGGFGLGLAIAKSIADRLGTTLLATSEPGSHTEFRLLIY